MCNHNKGVFFIYYMKQHQMTLLYVKCLIQLYTEIWLYS